MNYLLLPTLLIAVFTFFAGMRLSRRTTGITFFILCVLGLVMALPGILFAVYYLKFLGEPIWLYQFRSMPLSELSAGGAGFVAGLWHRKLSWNERFRRIAGGWFFPGILGLGLHSQNEWRDTYEFTRFFMVMK